LSNSYDPIELSETGKYLLIKGEKLQVFDLKTSETVKNLDIPIASSYGWYRGDSEIWYGLSGESVKTYNLETGVVKIAKRKDIESLKIVNDKRYGVRIDNLEDSKPDDIVLYDFDTGESTKIITSKEKVLTKLQSKFFSARIILLRDEDKLLLTVSGIGDDSDKLRKRFLSSQIDEFYLLDIKSGKTKKLLSVQGGLTRYDYSPVTNSIIYTDDGRLPFKTILIQ
jgi:hypothetical protein